MSNFIHRFLNPHCPDCALERNEDKFCESCETLKQQLARVSNENKQLLDRLIELTSPVNQVQEMPEAIEEFKPKFVPWAIRRAELEKADRENARQLEIRKQEMFANLKAADKQKVDVSDLEKEMEIIQEERENKNAS